MLKQPGKDVVHRVGPLLELVYFDHQAHGLVVCIVDRRLRVRDESPESVIEHRRIVAGGGCIGGGESNDRRDLSEADGVRDDLIQPLLYERPADLLLAVLGV